MLIYIVRRLLLMIPTLFGVTLLVFTVMALAPGGIGGPGLNDEGVLQGEEGRRIREYYERRYGLNKPLVVQYGWWLNAMSPLGWEPTTDETASWFNAITPVVLERLDDGSNQWHMVTPGFDSQTLTSTDVWTFGVKMPDMGESLSRRRPIVDLLRDALPITMLLNVISIPIIYGIGILSGLIAARHRGKLFDVGSGAVFLGLWSVPTIWAGVMMIGLLANRQYIKLFPTSGIQSPDAADMTFLPRFTDAGFEHGFVLDMLWHLALPIACLTYGGFAFLSKLTRTSILENLNADYVRTARAKGLDENVVLFRHVFRNSTLALITVAAGILPALLGGSIIVETIFSIPGMGRLAVEAVQYRDRELVLSITFVGGFIGLTSEIIRDICYAIADPRVSYE